ncbi:MAG: hypothetical protein A2X83_04005 [Desulfuromonadales bacterium GWD2_54_10]|nr:MAG: hypothetical protein A2X83_04005 [Desulfuromonadales bacterium GWD2_54_10]
MTNNNPRQFPVLLPLLYASILGIVGFLSGFLGPIYLNPYANQGPMLGIFSTGPIGVILGYVLGKIVVGEQPKTSIVIATPLISAVILATITLYCSLPDDLYQGFIIDAEVSSCQQPKSFVVAAEARWESVKSTPEYKLRPEWKNDITRMIETDKGVVLTLQVHRKRKIYKQRKPWNRGHIVATAWKTMEAPENYFMRNVGESCAECQVGQRAFYSPIWESSQVSPPDLLPTFLGFNTLKEVPVELQAFAKK